MPSYSVSQKIRTVATIDTTMRVGSITLWTFPRRSGASVQSWAADIAIDAVNIDEAVSMASERIIPLLDRLALVTQSAFSMAAQSYLVRRLSGNPSGIFYMISTRARHPNGMRLWSPEQLADIEALANAPAVALRNFREAATATTAQGLLSRS